MHIDYLIIGQGISGTFLSWYLQKERKSFFVIDNNHPVSASRIAAGIINPVTGRRLVRTWIIDELMPFAWKAYTGLGTELGISAISQKNIIDFFPNPQMREIFIERMDENENFLHSFPDQNLFRNDFQFDFGCGEISPAYLVHLEVLLPAWRKKLEERNQLLPENFDLRFLQVSNDKIKYKSITADSVIFCDGISSYDHSWFSQLPFSLNKGEALIIKSENTPDTFIFKKGLILAPLIPEFFWIGTNYLWDFKNANPTPEFRISVEKLINEWLKHPFRIVDHHAAIRPATLERRPFVGLHPKNPRIGILNGMGTKGCSLAPYFAKQLVNNLLYKKPIHAEADIQRFEKILLRNGP